MQPQPESDKGAACSICEHERAVRVVNPFCCPDCAELVIRACDALSIARQDGVEQGYHPSSWREAKNRLDHAATHIYMHKRGEQGEDHLAHAICDLVMSYDK